MTSVADILLDPYANLLGQALDGAVLALCHASGEMASARVQDAPLAARCLAELAAQNVDWSSAERLDLELASGARVLRRKLESWEGSAGWLVLQAPSGRDTAAARRALDQIAECIGRELGLREDVDGLTRELTSRYEELNLVYGLGDIHRIEGGDGSFDALLQNLLQHLDLVLAALFTPGSRRPAYAIDTRRHPTNADLLLTQIGGELWHYTLAAAAPVILNGPDSARRPYLLTHTLNKVLTCLVPAAGGEVGMLALVRAQDGADFTSGDRSLASVIASQIGIMLRNRHLLQRMQRFGEQMASALITAVEAKDSYTRGHSERVQDISVRIGQGMALRPSLIDDLFWGALLHDVGKIGIPDVILSKPCRLTDEEYTYVKTHPERSYEILSQIEFLSQHALDGARYHQERFDGKGYPRGLRGHDIPLSARVIAVADTYDAITTSRAYRPGRDHHAAMQEIDKASGDQLDPEVVSAFQKLCADDLGWIAPQLAGQDRRDE